VTAFASAFGEHISAYLVMKRSLGLKYREQEKTLRAFDRYVVALKHQGPLTPQLALSFAGEKPALSRPSRARRYQVVRHFAEYLSAFDLRTPRFDPRALLFVKERKPAYIYTERELGRLLHEARGISIHYPIRGVTFRAVLGLMASTGLRTGEVVRLDRVDVDLSIGEILVRQTKFKKDRIVPLHPTTQDELRAYAIARDQAYSRPRSMAFFRSTKGRFSEGTLQAEFARLTRRLGMRRPGRRAPRLHDFRHSFATRRIVAWYREGKDVQAMLPVLATYLGHSNYSETAYYISAVPDLMTVAAQRYFRSFAPDEGGS